MAQRSKARPKELREPKFRCGSCQQTFPSHAQFLDHLDTAHKKEIKK
jgi:hypothetical protein